MQKQSNSTRSEVFLMERLEFVDSSSPKKPWNVGESCLGGMFWIGMATKSEFFFLGFEFRTSSKRSTLPPVKPPVNWLPSKELMKPMKAGVFQEIGM